MSAQQVADEMRVMVREHVTMFLADGLQRAFARVAKIYGLTARRVRAYWNSEIKTVPAHEADAIRASRHIIAAERQRILNAELEALKERYGQLERRQGVRGTAADRVLLVARTAVDGHNEWHCKVGDEAFGCSSRSG